MRKLERERERQRKGDPLVQAAAEGRWFQLIKSETALINKLAKGPAGQREGRVSGLGRNECEKHSIPTTITLSASYTPTMDHPFSTLFKISQGEQMAMIV